MQVDAAAGAGWHGRADVGEIEAWTDEQYRAATDLFTVLSAKGQVDRQAVPAFEPPALREAYRAMLRARALDAAARELVKSERIGSYAHSTGTEAAVVGAMAALSPEDVVAPGRRAAGAAIAGAIRSLVWWRSCSATPTTCRAAGGSPAAQRRRAPSTSCRPPSMAARSFRKPPVSPGPPRCRRSRRSRWR